TRHRDGAMAIGIGLDRGDQPPPPSQPLHHCQVVGQRFTIDLCPERAQRFSCHCHQEVSYGDHHAVKNRREIACPARVDFPEGARLEAIEPGRYRLRVAGLASDVADTDSFLVIARPIEKWKMVVAILAIIASAALALGGLIASLATLVKFQSG